ncbi:MAG: alpha-1,4-glucan--maltose-1-phosphate maltosyltransferase [Sinobacteraceae bacterium]|nr:alpha-1,4-glucan--maltose-1-phosphate maltosyltransferase [Nevskiaceae bacterium]MBV9913938.1 alpha-1,4-glucan--maltose-1-phosphate maltosyltransferase [Nevskiaceae bacterium]
MSKVRVVIESIAPSIDCGRFPIKRTIGETVVVEADVFTDGHDAVTALLLYRHESSQDWHSLPMEPLGNDRWRAHFTVQVLGTYQYTVKAWVDHLETWRRGLAKKYEAGQDISLDLRTGAALAGQLATRITGSEAQRVREWAGAIVDPKRDLEARVALTQSATLRELELRHPDPEITLQWPSRLLVSVDRERARYSTWYEMFPRSAAAEPGKHGTFADVERLLPYVASMGFDVLYLPPIHPIGVTERKGPNNNPTAAADDLGSPWAIGGAEGGHTAIHPQLGTLADFKRLLATAGEHGIELALDIAFQSTPDHPYVREHPEWFLKRPDGSIQYAENPPKKYQDIYPFHFESEAHQALWDELRRVIEYWITQGVRIFRVDNPHTKPFSFWEELITRIHHQRPDVIFLAEAFTRPKVMYRLAKLGFTQSYNYFPWRNSKRELTEYFTELGRPPVSDFFRPNLWPNTPDILPEYLQYGGRGGFMIRLILAATLGASYGIYGPAFELMEARPREPGSEEYLDSEKYQLRHWNREDPGSLCEFIALVNRIRRNHPALQSDRGLQFHETDNEMLLAYSKTRSGATDSILVVTNVDPHHTQSGWLHLDLHALGLPVTGTYQMHDLLSGARFLWEGARNFVSLDPHRSPAHIFQIRRRVRSERDFDYFL